MAFEEGGKVRAERVLVVDDNADNRALIEAILDSEGYDVLSVQDGFVGVSTAQDWKPDCIILDIQMPGIDGFEVCRRLKSDLGTRDVPVLFLSAKNLDEASVVRGLELGGQDYLLKPFSFAELIARVRVLVRIKRVEDDLRAAYDDLEAAQDMRLQAQKLETIRQVVATLIHDLNQPLTAVIGNAELLQLDSNEPDSAEAIAVILREADRMSNIVQRLASANRLEVVSYAGKVRMLAVSE